MKNEVPKNRIFRRWLRLTKWLLVFLLLATFGWFLLSWFFNLPPGLRETPVASPLLFDRKGKAMRYLTANDFTRTAPVEISQIPQQLIDCTLAAEDKRFYLHHGIDVFATERAGYDFGSNRRVIFAASTITQQLAKISSLPTSRNLKAKFYEAMAARLLEMSWEKGRILEAYFNRPDHGNLPISPTEAACFYFQKPLSDLSLGECALLAGLPQAPSRLNPIRNPKMPWPAEWWCLIDLLPRGEYCETAIELARAEPLKIRPSRERKAVPWLNRIPGGNLRVRATLDLALQEDTETIVREETAKLKSSNLRYAAVGVIDNAAGDILAMVSSADWKIRATDKFTVRSVRARPAPLSSLSPTCFRSVILGNFQHLSLPIFRLRFAPSKVSSYRKTTIGNTTVRSRSALLLLVR